MSISYEKLFKKLQENNITSYIIRKDKIIPQGTLTKLRNNQNVNISTIITFCKLLNCQPGDILEYVPDSVGENEAVPKEEAVSKEKIVPKKIKLKRKNKRPDNQDNP